MEVVRAHGLEIAYRRVGSGPPLVLVHGGASDGRLWTPQLTGLAGDCTVVAWDEPGAGRSSDLPRGFRLADYANCLAVLVEALALGPVHLAGLSWGGTVALELYRLHPGLVATLILADSYAGWKGSLPADEVRARVAHLRRTLEAPAAEFDPTLPGLFAAGPPAEFVPLLEEMAAAVRPETLESQLLLMADTDVSDMLPRIAVPTLLVWGEQDARSPLAVARQFERAIPDAELLTGRPPLDNPDLDLHLIEVIAAASASASAGVPVPVQSRFEPWTALRLEQDEPGHHVHDRTRPVEEQ